MNHPNIVMNLSVQDKTTSIISTQTANINLNSMLQFTLSFSNNSTINLVNGTIEIPIDNNFIFSSIDISALCIATYNSSSKKIFISIPLLAPLTPGYITFTLLPQPNLNSGNLIIIQSTAISYYNDISTTKIYGGEKSNTITCSLPPGISLKPNPIYQINETTQFIVTPPGNTTTIINYFKNTGGGYDSFLLIIAKVTIPYTLYIDDLKIAEIPANTLYQSDLPVLSNLAPNTSKIIRTMTTIPIGNTLGVRYDFLVTVKSKTTPYPEKTILCIDPSPF